MRMMKPARSGIDSVLIFKVSVIRSIIFDSPTITHSFFHANRKILNKYE